MAFPNHWEKVELFKSIMLVMFFIIFPWYVMGIG